MINKFPNNSKVCFIGDSLTAANNVQWLITDCYKRNTPNFNIEFINCGIAGGTAEFALNCLADDVFVHNPTHAVVAYGINDCQRWELNRPRSEFRYDLLNRAFETFKISLREIIDVLISRNVEVILCTPAPYDEYSESDEPVLKGCCALISEYSDFVRKLAAEKNLPLCDYHKFLTHAMQTDVIISPDRVHPTPHGYFVMAKHFLSLQGIDISNEPDAIPDYLKEWHDYTCRKCEIYSGELMIVQNYTLPTEQKLDFVKKYLSEDVERPEAYLRISNNYLKFKPCQSEIEAKIKQLYRENVLMK